MATSNTPFVGINYDETNPTESYAGVEVNIGSETHTFNSGDARADLVAAEEWLTATGHAWWARSSSVDHYFMDIDAGEDDEGDSEDCDGGMEGALWAGFEAGGDPTWGVAFLRGEFRRQGYETDEVLEQWLASFAAQVYAKFTRERPHVRTAVALLDGKMQPAGDKLLARIVNRLLDPTNFDEEFPEPEWTEKVAMVEGYLVSRERKRQTVLAA